jgi:uncharacterized protein with LGFP repeats
MAPQVGLESTRKPKFNNMQGHGWQRSTRKAVVERQTDRKWIAGIVESDVRRGKITDDPRLVDDAYSPLQAFRAWLYSP